ncbi:hypothetical protein D6850_08765 [Roseovarius spongiae]|uniref:Co-chaperone DjlA N-terminal domain-containing protein n=2 Tax=Roseovarius spongiae TaxID=2320272 RepID=A0A3A8AYP2_9RHOB|nr:TerB family tellurite resistance protein [Roseovarius spongiae]RKF15421.1 hypothetical protein D6850_08765 [Roseovarius spongiae]
MLTRIMDLFKGDTPAPLPEPDARIALGALMVRVIKADEGYRAEEIGRIERLLARINGLGQPEAAKLRATCEKIEAAAPATRAFALLIRETVSLEARVEAQGALWEVMLADGLERDEDLERMERMRAALGLSEEDCAPIRARDAAR